MAFSDPISITVLGTATSLPLREQGATSRFYVKDDDSVSVKIQHTFAKQKRSGISIKIRKAVADPLVPSISAYHDFQVNLTVLNDRVGGVSAADAKTVVKDLITWLTASTDANLVKFLGGES